MNNIQYTPHLRKIFAGIPLALVVILSVFSLALAPFDGISQEGPQAPDASVVYVNDDGPCAGGSPCYATIQEAVAAVDTGGTVYVEPGVYYASAASRIDITRPMTIRGARYLDDPRSTGANPRAGGESYVRPLEDLNPPLNPVSPVYHNLFTVQANNVTIEGFFLDGNNPNLACPVGYPHRSNGVCLFASGGIGTGNYDAGFVAVSTLTIRNNIIQSFTMYGVTIGSKLKVAQGNHLVTQNVFDNLGYALPNTYFPDSLLPWGAGRALSLRENQFGSLFANRTLRSLVGIEVEDYTSPSSGGLFEVKDNVISSVRQGIWVGRFFDGVPLLTISGNTVNTSSGTNNTGIEIESMRDSSQALVTGNTIAPGVKVGISIFYITSQAGLVIQNTTITSPTEVGVTILNNKAAAGTADGQARVTMNNVDISGGPTGVLVLDHPSAPATSSLVLTMINGSSVTGTTVDGLLVSGPDASVSITGSTFTGNTVGVRATDGGKLASLTNNIISANSDDGIRITGGAVVGQVGSIFNNDLSNNLGSGIDNPSGEAINASANWWGDSAAGTVSAEAGPNVDYTPWFNYGTDTNATTVGFQGDFSWLWVDDAPPNTSATRIGEALGLTTPGGRVSVQAGIYNESVTLNQNANLVFEGNATITGALNQIQGTLTAPAGTLTLQGNFLRSGGNYVSSGGTILMNGPALQLLGGSSATMLNVLNLENSAGIKLAGAIQVNGHLVMNNTVFDLATYTLTLGTAATVDGGAPSSTNMVVADDGLLCKLYAGPGAFTFPIGDNTGTVNYSPVQLSLTGGAYASASICIKVTDAAYPGNGATNKLTRYWTVASNGISGTAANFTFYYASDAEDVVPSNESLLKGMQFPTGAAQPVMGANVNTASNSFVFSTNQLSGVFTAGNAPPALGVVTVTITRLSATANQISWTVQNNLPGLTYQVYRSSTFDGARTAVGAPIPSQTSQPYIRTDPNRPPFTTAYYWLFVHSPDNNDYVYGPYVLPWLRIVLPFAVR